MSGHIVEFVMVLICVFATIYYMWGAIKGSKFELRPMPQLEAISDGLDRAVETGRPAWLCPGFGELYGQYAGMLIAGLSILRYSVRLAVRKNAPVRVWANSSDALPIMDGIYREACVSEGKPEAYSRDNVIYEPEMYTFIGMLHRDGVALFVNVGAVGGGSMAEPMMAIRRLGGMIVSGTARYVNNGYLAVYADYPLFSDDIFAAAAIASEDDAVKASIMSGDIIKVLLLLLVMVAALIGFGGFPVWTWLAY